MTSLVVWEPVHGSLLGVNLLRGKGRAGRTTRCGRAYHMWLGAPELPPNLGPANKILTQLVELC
jgi:hypothetical protein